MGYRSVSALAAAGMSDTRQMSFADLHTSQRDGVKGAEVIVSISTVAPATILPKHRLHTVVMKAESAPILVFRVLALGQPGRVLV